MLYLFWWQINFLRFKMYAIILEIFYVACCVFCHPKILPLYDHFSSKLSCAVVWAKMSWAEIKQSQEDHPPASCPLCHTNNGPTLERLHWCRDPDISRKRKTTTTPFYPNFKTFQHVEILLNAKEWGKREIQNSRRFFVNMKTTEEMEEVTIYSDVCGQRPQIVFCENPLVQ